MALFMNKILMGDINYEINGWFNLVVFGMHFIQKFTKYYAVEEFINELKIYNDEIFLNDWHTFCDVYWMNTFVIQQLFSS